MAERIPPRRGGEPTTRAVVKEALGKKFREDAQYSLIPAHRAVGYKKGKIVVKAVEWNGDLYAVAERDEENPK
jgi:hypothetical protein